MKGKPSWMLRETWSEFCTLHPYYRCVTCGDDSYDLSSVDHVVPRACGGTDDVSNLQWMCVNCNCRKGPRDDLHWSQPLYFDNRINLDGFRYVQRFEGFEKILQYSEWFSRPFSQISRRLYVPAWIVGAGKTLFGPTTAFAINHLILRDCGPAHPRVDRILVLTKDQAIRDQVANDLSSDIKCFGICGINPRVATVNDGKKLELPANFDRCDIVVSCIHMFFEKNGQPRSDIAGILAHFPLIVIDEPHFAVDQVLRIVDAASSSICFGTTGSPIDADGQQLKSFVLFSVYGYQEACVNDNSLKLLPSPDDSQWEEAYQEIDIDGADMHGGGEKYAIKRTEESNDYSANLRPAITVAESVVRHVFESDKSFSAADKPIFATCYKLAKHRSSPPAVANLSYPLHAMIRVASVPVGKHVQDQINKQFDSDRARYPRSMGWHCEMIHSCTLDGNGNGHPGQPLKPDHPWMYAKNNDGRLSENSSRFLIVVGMGREGVNNPMCGVVGLACSCLSMIEIVQRVIGRQLRSVIKWLGDVLSVPPDGLDTVKIITHRTFGNRATVEQAARFALNMEDFLDRLPTMEELVAGSSEDATLPDLKPESILTVTERIQIVGAVGAQKIEGRSPIEREPIVDVFGGDDEKKRQGVRDWVETVAERPMMARKALGIVGEIREIHRVMREYANHTPTDEELIRFIEREDPNLVDQIPRLSDPGMRKVFTSFYRIHAERFHLPDLPINTKLSAIKSRLANEVLRDLGGYFVGDKGFVHSGVYSAMRLVLGVPNGEKLNDGGTFDTPECHVILLRREVMKNIRGWVVNDLIKRGCCPNLKAGFVIADDDVGPNLEVEVACDVF